jgi:hypothetical protein
MHEFCPCVSLLAGKWRSGLPRWLPGRVFSTVYERLAEASCQFLPMLNQPLHHAYVGVPPSATKRSHPLRLSLFPSVRGLINVDLPGRARSNVLGIECQFVTACCMLHRCSKIMCLTCAVLQSP